MSKNNEGINIELPLMLAAVVATVIVIGLGISGQLIDMPDNRKYGQLLIIFAWIAAVCMLVNLVAFAKIKEGHRWFFMLSAGVCGLIAAWTAFFGTWLAP